MMIMNEREYRITKAAVEKFRASLANLAKLRKEGKYDVRKIKLQESATKSILDELQEQIDEYDSLKSGRFELSLLDSVESLPKNLVRARIALGWTQKELAKRLKTTEQQIQKYEATDYGSASLNRISEIVAILKSEGQRTWH